MSDPYLQLQRQRTQQKDVLINWKIYQFQSGQLGMQWCWGGVGRCVQTDFKQQTFSWTSFFI